jgi:hypothetical protein
MSIIDLQEDLKDVSDNGLMEAFRSGSAPQFLVLGELQRRKRMRDDFKRREAADMPTVAEEMITGAGVPQEGLMAMAGAMAPKTNVAQDTGIDQAMPMQATRAPQQPQMMADGGFLDYLRSVLGAEKPDRSIDTAIGSRVSPDLDDFLAQDSMRDRDSRSPTFLPFPTASGSFGNDADALLQSMQQADDAERAKRMESDPTQEEIDRLLGVINDPDSSPPEVATAADQLQKLQERIAVTQTGGNISATAEDQGIELEQPYIMGPFGNPRLDPSYKTPGKTEQSIVDAAAVQGTDALKEIEDTGLYPDSIIREAEKIANLSDYEEAINPINKDIMDVQNALKNPYIPEESRNEMERFLRRAEQIKTTLATDSGADQLFTPNQDLPPNITGGYEGLVDTSPKETKQFIPEMPVDPSSVMPPMATDETDGVDDDIDKIDSGFGSVESQLANLLADRKKRSEQNKWLALAEAGFAMMGPAATFGQGVAKGGQAGLKALQTAQKGQDAFETDMLKLQTQLGIADARNKTTLAAAMLRKKDPKITASALTAAQARVNEARDVLANATTQADQVAAMRDLKEAIALRDEFTRMYSGQIGANIASNTAGTTGGIKDFDLTT